MAFVCLLLLLIYCISPVLVLSINPLFSVCKQTMSFNCSLDYFLAYFLGLSFLCCIWAYVDRYFEKRLLCIIWLLKSIMVILIMPVYELHYRSLDAFLYFNTMSSGPFHFSWGNGTQNIINISGYLSSIGLSFFRVQVMIFSMIGFLAIWAFHHAFQVMVGRKSLVFVILLLVYPSFLFWSSILGKDPLVIFAIAVWFLGIVLVVDRSYLRGILFMTIPIFIILYLRTWVSGILVLVTVGSFLFFLGHIILGRFFFLYVAMASVFFALMSDQIYSVIVETSLFERLVLHHNNFKFGGSSNYSNFDFYSYEGFLNFIFSGSFATLFAPLPWSAKNIFEVCMGIEGAVSAFLCLLALALFLRSRLRFANFVVPFLFVFIWTAVYSFVSSANLGTGSRFRAQVIPFLVIILAVIFDHFMIQRGQDVLEDS